MQAVIPMAKAYITAVQKTCGQPAVKMVDEETSSYILLATLHHVTDACFHGSDAGQCTALSGWYIDTYTKLNSGGGDGGEVAAKLVAANPGAGLKLVDTPKPYSIFSFPISTAGHTGVVLGVLPGGDVITLEVNWPVNYSQDPNDDGQVAIRKYNIKAESGVKFVYVGNTSAGGQ